MTTPAERTADNTEKIAVNTDPQVVADTIAATDFKASTTTAEENRVAADQRERRAIQHQDAVSVAATRASRQSWINMIWEYTQSFVAVIVVTATSVGVFIGRVIDQSVVPFPAEWWTIVGLVIGFYFGRTNHSRMGDEPRSGRSGDPLDDR